MDNQRRGFAAGFLRFVFKVFLALLAMVFAACLLAAGVLKVLFTLIKSLVTWQKPAPWVAFPPVQKYSARGQWPSNSYPQRERQNVQTPDVVDVEVREVAPSEPKH